MTPALSASDGFGAWLKREGVSLAFTSYESGMLGLVGLFPNGVVSISLEHFQSLTGIACTRNALILGTKIGLWRLVGRDVPVWKGKPFDRVYSPRSAVFTGDVDCHEVIPGPIFVNTKFSCLAQPSDQCGFEPVWKPSFVSRLAPEDRCHLSGVAAGADGRPKYVTAAATSDVADGWHGRRRDGGVVIDVESNQIVAEGLSMPHSPRLHAGELWFLDSGRGNLMRGGEAVAFLPGFARGLAMWGDYAIATLSLPRGVDFGGLELGETLARRGAAPWAGLVIVNTSSGDIVAWLKVGVAELFDVAVIPDAACPAAISPLTDDFSTAYTVRQDADALV